MLKKILFAVAAIVVVICGYASSKPAEYVISREITINAPIEKVFPYLNNQKLAALWGPWMDVDPAAKMEISGPEEGIGSKTSWTAGKQLGTGSATITEVEPNQRVRTHLEYTEPMKMVQEADYIVKDSGGQTIVTWRVEGKNTFPGRVMCIFVNMDKQVGKFFEQGLNNLKNLIEKGSK